MFCINYIYRICRRDRLCRRFGGFSYTEVYTFIEVDACFFDVSFDWSYSKISFK
eukprot:UN03461